MVMLDSEERIINPSDGKYNFQAGDRVMFRPADNYLMTSYRSLKIYYASEMDKLPDDRTRFTSYSTNDDISYYFTMPTADLVVEASIKKEVVIVASDPLFVYGSGSVTITKDNNALSTAEYSNVRYMAQYVGDQGGMREVTLEGLSKSDVGQVSMYAVYESDTEYGESAPIEFEITPKPITVSVAEITKTYDGSRDLPTTATSIVSIAAGQLVSHTANSGATVTDQISIALVTPEDDDSYNKYPAANAATYTDAIPLMVSLSGDKADNYTLTGWTASNGGTYTKSVTGTINPKTITPILTDFTPIVKGIGKDKSTVDLSEIEELALDGVESKPAASGSTSGEDDKDDVQAYIFDFNFPANEQVGPCTVTLTIGLEGSDAANYTLSDAYDTNDGVKVADFEVNGEIVDVYTITFDHNGHGTAPSSITDINAGTEIIDFDIFPTLDDDGDYSFMGWYYDGDPVSEFEVLSVDDDITLTAHWKKEITADEIAALLTLSKTYDGETWVKNKNGVLLHNDDNLPLSLAYNSDITLTFTKIAYNDANVGTGKTITAKADEYEYDAEDGNVFVLPADEFTVSTSGEITKAEVKFTVSLDGWQYGDNDAHTPSITQTDGITLTDEQMDAITYSYKLTSDDDSHYSTEQPTQAGNYTVMAVFEETSTIESATAETTFDIEPVQITTSDITVSGTAQKEYDGNANVTNLSDFSVSIDASKIVGDEQVSVKVVEGTYPNAEAGTYSDVKLTIALDGDDDVISNYELAETEILVSGEISEPIRSYTITFDTDGGSDIESITAEVNATIDAPEDPTKEGYTFAGWDPAMPATMPNEDLTLTAQWTPNEYDIHFVVDGAATTKQFAYQTTPTFGDANPTKPNNAEYTYAFNGWEPAIVAVTGEATYTAQFDSTKNQYAVQFVNGNVVLQSGDLEYGAMPEYKAETPTKSANAQYTYTFKGWSPEIDKVTADAIYTAQFDSTVNSYKIIFVVDGEETIKVYEYGQIPSYGDGNPTKTTADGIEYTFSRWNPAIVAVAADATYTAEFTSRDAEKPVVNVVTINDIDATSGSTIECIGSGVLAIAASDNNSGVAKIEYTINGVTNVYTEPVVIDAPGKYSISVVATDVDGNISEPFEANAVIRREASLGVLNYTYRQLSGADMVLQTLDLDGTKVYSISIDGEEYSNLFVEPNAFDDLVLDNVKVGTHKFHIYTSLNGEKHDTGIEASLTVQGFIVETEQRDINADGYCQGEHADITLAFINMVRPKYYKIKQLHTEYQPFEDVASLAANIGKLRFLVDDDIEQGNVIFDVTFTNDPARNTESDTAHFDIKINYASSYIIKLFDDIIGIDNHEDLFTEYQWYKNGAKIDGADRQYYQVSGHLTGKYGAYVTTTSGERMKICSVDMDAQSISKALRHSVSVFPNPARPGEEITVELLNYDDTEYEGCVIRIVNGVGALVATIDHCERVNTITLPSGTYTGYVLRNGKNEKVSFKLIVK